MFDVISNFGYRDVVDIVIVAMIIYYILNIIEKTRTVYVLFGLAVLAGLYLLSQVGELFTLNWILGHFLGSIILIAVILFQNDIRRALITLGRNPLILRLTPGNSQEVLVDEIVKAVSLLANRQIGALIALERKTSLSDFVEIGMRLDAWVSKELLISIFNPSSPLHDGGVIIGRNNKILSAGSFFPLAMDPDLERDLGTRHRAAIGLSRETDAIVIVVSEETGIISLAFQGNLIRGLDATSLTNSLLEMLELKKKKGSGLLSHILHRRERAH
ncbi:MAG: membrane protein [Deltaproteobacteria bacterium]|jgi:diadenylate cyclase|nr:MAG: membrane protein [Deltaproteobacteria bacterium]